MAEINPNPYKDGDPLGPTGRITAIFHSLSDLKAALTDAKNAGFTGDQTAVFVGAEGAIQLDASGVIRNIEALKMFQNALCDEEELFIEFNEALTRGEAVVSIFVDNDELKKTTIVDLLKSHNARKINYWGKWQFVGLG